MNTFWPVYKSLESEVVSLTNYILFTDDQMKVYSLSIGNLIIRCAIEIEAISKELYASLGGPPKLLDTSTGHDRNPYFDTDCIKLLVDRWHIDKKKIQITSPNIYLSQDKSILTPLHKAQKRGTSGSAWKQAYQKIKHSRAQENKIASIENLLNALGALYILNLYYRDEAFWSETPIKDRREFTPNSEIFTPFLGDATHILMSPEMGDEHMDALTNPTLDESVYIEKILDSSCKGIHEALCANEIRANLKIKKSKEYSEYLEAHPEDAELGTSTIAQRMGINIYSLLKQGSTFGQALGGLREKEIVLNKHSQIYPTLTFAQYIESPASQRVVDETMQLINSGKVVLPKI